MSQGSMHCFGTGNFGLLVGAPFSTGDWKVLIIVVQNIFDRMGIDCQDKYIQINGAWYGKGGCKTPNALSTAGHK